MKLQKHWVYRIHVRKSDGSTEAVYIGQTSDFDRQCTNHRHGIREAAEGRATDGKYGHLSQVPETLVSFEVLAEVYGKDASLKREADEIRAAWYSRKVLVLNAFKDHERGAALLMKTPRGEPAVLARLEFKERDRIVAAVPGSRRRELVKLRNKAGIAALNPNKRFWLYEPTGYTWQAAQVCWKSR